MQESIGFVQRLLDEYPDTASAPNNTKDLALHMACANKAPIAIIDSLFDANLGGLVSQYDKNGLLSIQCAVLFTDDTYLVLA